MHKLLQSSIYAPIKGASLSSTLLLIAGKKSMCLCWKLFIGVIEEGVDLHEVEGGGKGTLYFIPLARKLY